MHPTRTLAAFAALALATPSLGAAAQVAVDVAPVHSIVARVMAGIGEPSLIVPPGASPHGYALRPSDAAALEAADLVVWVGPSLSPWLEGPLDALAPDAARLALAEADGVRLLPVRAGGPFEAHEHGDEHDHDHGDEDHADHDGHDHSETHDHDHGTAEADDHGHDDHAHAEGAVDPHLWLDPRNGVAIAAAVADALAAVDPDNAAAYTLNAAGFATEMDALGAELEAALAPLAGKGYFVFHDAYAYFEDRFGLPAAGSIALGDAEAPAASRVREIGDRIASEEIVCVFAEPQFEPKLIETVIEGSAARKGMLDPIGAALPPGADLYPALLRGLATDLAACLAP
jgi:zinc transport system substrate-binding protein